MITIGLVTLYKFVPVYITPLMIIRTIEAAGDGKEYSITREWVPIDQISPEMVRAVIASEDNLFPTHNGFDIDGIRKAMKHNQSGGTIHGGSTISQQTAKNVFCTNNRNFIRKGFETYFTILIEAIWGKERIMEVYLNVIETGDGMFGVEAAARKYFKRSASKLTRSQSALIAVCLPNPRRFSPSHPSSYIIKRQLAIMNLMPKLGKIELE